MDLQLSELSALDREIHEPARLAILATRNAVDEADAAHHGIDQGKPLEPSDAVGAGRLRGDRETFRGKIPLTVCRLTKAGRAAFERYRATLRKVLLK